MRTNRSEDILNYFIKHQNRLLSIEELADTFLLSTRQIKNYINAINEEDTIIIKKNKLYSLMPGYIKNEKKDAEYTPKQRVNIIISRLLTDEDIDIFDLSDELYVSRPTVESDLKKVRRIVESFDLKVVNNNDILSIEGLEKNLRKLSSYMIRNTEYKGFSYADSNFFLNNKYETEFIRNGIQQIFNQCHFIYNDYSINNILLHLIITIDRLKNNYYVEAKSSSLKIDAQSLKAATAVADFLGKSYDIEFNKNEIDSMAAFLSCNLATIDCRYIDSKYINNLVDPESIRIANVITDKVCDFYFLEGFDDVFMTRFILHVDNLIKRQENNFSARNPLSENIFETYPLIYDIAVFAANIFKQETGYKINNDEISLLALHIGSFIETNNSNKDKITALYVYTDYHAFYQNNILTLQNRFSSLNIKYSISILDYQKDYNPSPDIDLIISEVHIPGAVYVSSFVKDEQCQDIYNAIVEKSKKKNVESFSTSLKQLFTKDMFYRNLNYSDEFEVIHNLIDNLKPLGIFSEEYEESVIEREKTASTCFTNHVAIPHAITQHVKQSFISIINYDRPQKWGGKDVNLVIMIGISYPERKIFRSVFNNLIKLISDEGQVKKLSSCLTYEDIIKCLIDNEL